MGKIRVAALGDEQQEVEQKKKAEVRRQAKAAKKTHEKETAEVTSTSDSAQAVSGKEVTASEKTEHGKQKSDGKKEQKTHVKSKRYRELAVLVDKNKVYSLSEAVSLAKKTSTTKFEGTIEIHINLAVQMLGNKNEFRGKVNLPHGTGKEVKVAIADDELLKKLEAGIYDFDVLVAHPTMMAKLAKYARTLGPKGLMPNPKNGTVSPDPEKRAKELAHGEVNYKTEQNNPILHLGIAKVSMEDKKITENIQALILSIGKNKLAKVTLNATMGPGIPLDLTAL